MVFNLEVTFQTATNSVHLSPQLFTAQFFDIQMFQIYSDMFSSQQVTYTFEKLTQGIVNTIANVFGTLFLQSVGLILDRYGNNFDSWSILFYILGTSNLIGKFQLIADKKTEISGALYTSKFTSGKVQEWAKESTDESKKLQSDSNRTE